MPFLDVDSPIVEEHARETFAPPPLFQFRLRSLLILMVLVAVSMSLVPIWQRAVVLPNSEYYLRSSPEEARRWAERIDRIYSWPLSCMALVAMCGIWFAIARPYCRSSDIWLGVMFALPGSILAPSVGFLIALVMLSPGMAIGGITGTVIGMPAGGIIGAFTEILALVGWLVPLKRYRAAGILLIYYLAAGVIAAMYFSEWLANEF